jgi:hypothetical protein
MRGIADGRDVLVRWKKERMAEFEARFKGCFKFIGDCNQTFISCQ